MACNERCPFCNVPVEDYERPTPPEAELLRELDAFVASGEQTLTLSGGEPTLYRKRLANVIARARKGGVRFVELQTNAVLLDAGYARELVDAGLTSAFVSLLSDDPALHDRLAGLEGAFQRCLSGIDALLDVGVSVTLNPVIARVTERRVAGYVDFVAERLPRVKVISLSAVQPHGRARKDPELMPDYAALTEEVPEALRRAAAHGILVLNPYCGLPACVGWAADPERSVEAIEAAAARSSGARHRARGLDNTGNKRHGPPCRECALRPRCGGAWHEYWDHRGGSGLRAPLVRIPPFGQVASAGQHVVAARDGLRPQHFAELARASRPTVWALTSRLAPGDAERLGRSGCTDLALWADAFDADTLRELHAIARDNAECPSELRLRVAVGLPRLGSFTRAHALISELARAGVDEVHLLVKPDERHRRFAEAVERELGIQVLLPKV